MRYHFRVNRESDGCWGECLELEGCVTQGETLDELESNAKEAIDLYLEEGEDSSLILPLPDTVNGREESVMEIAVEPGIAGPFLRRQRLVADDVAIGR